MCGFFIAPCQAFCFLTLDAEPDNCRECYSAYNLKFISGMKKKCFICSDCCVYIYCNVDGILQFVWRQKASGYSR